MFTYSNNTRLDDEDEDEKKKKGEKKAPFHAYEAMYSASQVHFYLSDEIGMPGEYTDMIHKILIAGPNDIVYIHLNTPGGRLDTGVQIVNAMQNSQGKIITVLEGMAFSLGTLIFLAGDEMVVNDHCMLMFHNFKGGILGKGNEMISQIEATVKWFETLAKKIYVPFLSEAEFNQITRGEDIWMHSPEIRRRLDVLIQHLSEEPKRKQKAKSKAKTKTKRAKGPRVPKAEPVDQPVK